MSDTPETDAFQQTEYCAYDSMWRRFAQKLERERDAYKSVLLEINELAYEDYDCYGALDSIAELSKNHLNKL